LIELDGEYWVIAPTAKRRDCVVVLSSMVIWRMYLVKRPLSYGGYLVYMYYKEKEMQTGV
jgi:hypothetical protein